MTLSLGRVDFRSRRQPYRHGFAFAAGRRFLPCLLILVLTPVSLFASPPPPLKVSDNQRFLVQTDGRPFFYLADTAWELFHRLNRREAVRYLTTRAGQGYTVIQAVALAELDGLTDPNPYGDLPLTAKDPARPAVTPGSDPFNAEEYDYWDHVEYIIDEANRRGLYVALLPSWGRWTTDRNPPDEIVLTPKNAQVYGEFLGRRFRRKSIIWILGGDRIPEGAEDTWRSLARGIAIGVNGKETYETVLMSFHPRGGHSSSEWFHDEVWLDFNMLQTGHDPAEIGQPWRKVSRDYAREPVKPAIDGEPLYEDHPIGFDAKRYGYSLDAHVRRQAYWAVFSGACGHTYGDHSVWQMYAPGRRPVNGPLFYWYEAIHRPGAAQMRHVRALIESRPVLSRVPDDSIVADPLAGADHIVATRGDGYLFIYSPQGRPFTVNLGKISGQRLKGYWYNPRTGTAAAAGVFPNQGTRKFIPPAEGFGADWVLVLDDAARNFPPPGTE